MATVANMTDRLPLAEFPACHSCRLFVGGSPPACLACVRQQLAVPGPDACPVCAQRTRSDGRCPNELCYRHDRRISVVHAIGYQDGALRRVINSYKYRGVRSWSVILGRVLVGWLEEQMATDPPGLIVANPGFSRGGARFGHAEEVVAAAAAADPASRWRFDAGSPAAIIKTRPTLRSADAQAWSKRVSGNELRSALSVPDPARTAGKRILVYDDICTTGTQLDAIAGCLLDQGNAARVEGVVLARALWRGEPGVAATCLPGAPASEAAAVRAG